MSNKEQVCYLKLKKDILKEKKEYLLSLLGKCELCPKECGVDRLHKEKGECKTGRWATISSFNPHFGEEPPLVGKDGSGTIFFTHCNLNCIFCQNFTISQLGEGEEISPKELAGIILSLYDRKCHNINFVSPTHVIAQIVEALVIAVNEGLDIPLVYNTGGYDKVQTLKILENIFDIYMPDMKYSGPDFGLEFSKVKDYPEINQMAVKEMHRQVGDLVLNKGVAMRGLVVRHLVLPHDFAGTKKVCEFISSKISKNTYLNIMDQYHPCYKAYSNSFLNRRISQDEFIIALDYANQNKLYRLAG